MRNDDAFRLIDPELAAGLLLCGLILAVLLETVL